MKRFEAQRGQLKGQPPISGRRPRRIAPFRKINEFFVRTIVVPANHIIAGRDNKVNVTPGMPPSRLELESET